MKQGEQRDRDDVLDRVHHRSGACEELRVDPADPPDQEPTCDVRDEEGEAATVAQTRLRFEPPNRDHPREPRGETLHRVQAAIGGTPAPRARTVSDGGRCSRDRAGDRPTHEAREENDRRRDRVPTARRDRQSNATGDDRRSHERREGERLQLGRRADENAPEADERERGRRVGQREPRRVMGVVDGDLAARSRSPQDPRNRSSSILSPQLPQVSPITVRSAIPSDGGNRRPSNGATSAAQCLSVSATRRSRACGRKARRRTRTSGSRSERRTARGEGASVSRASCTGGRRGRASARACR